MAVALEAGGLVKAAREWFRLQVAQVLVPAGCACGPECAHPRLLSTGLGHAFVTGALRLSVLAVRIAGSTLSTHSSANR